MQHGTYTVGPICSDKFRKLPILLYLYSIAAGGTFKKLRSVRDNR